MQSYCQILENLRVLTVIDLYDTFNLTRRIILYPGSTVRKSNNVGAKTK